MSFPHFPSSCSFNLSRLQRWVRILGFVESFRQPTVLLIGFSNRDLAILIFHCQCTLKAITELSMSKRLVNNNRPILNLSNIPNGLHFIYKKS